VVVDEVNMARDYERMVNRDYTGRQGTLLKLKEMKQVSGSHHLHHHAIIMIMARSQGGAPWQC